MNTFKIRMIVEYEVDYPDDWDEELVEFHLTESSWCGNNALQDIKKFLDTTGECLCKHANFELLREEE